MEGSPGRTGAIAVVVALITVFGGITTAVLSNWDKIAGSSPASQAAVNAVPAMQDPAPSAGNAVAGDSSAAEPAAGRGGVAPSEAASPAASASYPNIAGTWAGDEQAVIHFIQEGPDFHFDQYSNNVRVGDGRGRLDGRSITYQHRLTDGQRTLTSVCRGAVRSENRIEGICDAGDVGRFAFEMRRP